MADALFHWAAEKRGRWESCENKALLIFGWAQPIICLNHKYVIPSVQGSARADVCVPEADSRLCPAKEDIHQPDLQENSFQQFQWNYLEGHFSHKE